MTQEAAGTAPAAFFSPRFRRSPAFHRFINVQQAT
jgi:hypothetical protein